MSAWEAAAVRADLWQRFHIAEGLTAGHAEALADVALVALAPHLAARDAAVRRETLEEAAQLAFDATTDDPQPSWNDACEHMAEAIRALAPPQPQSGEPK